MSKLSYGIPLAILSNNWEYIFLTSTWYPPSRGVDFKFCGPEGEGLETSTFAYKHYKTVSRGVASSWHADFNVKHHVNRSVTNTSNSLICALIKVTLFWSVIRNLIHGHACPKLLCWSRSNTAYMQTCMQTYADDELGPELFMSAERCPTCAPRLVPRGSGWLQLG